MTRSQEISAYVERWENALRVLESMSEHERAKHFDMSDWGRETDCGTVACLAGHCSLDPWFRERGFSSYFDAKEGRLQLTGVHVGTFFGSVGDWGIFMRMHASYDEVVDLVKEHLAYLRDGGDPNTREGWST